MNKNRSFEAGFTNSWLYGVIIILALAATGFYWLAGKYLVIHDDGVSVVAKQSMEFQGTFVNVRDWQFDDFQQHPALRASLERADLNTPVRTALMKGMTAEMRQATASLNIPTDPGWLRSHYVILSEHGIAVIPRKYIENGGSEVDAFLDIRSWTNDDFKRNSNVQESLAAAGYSTLLIEMKVKKFGDLLDEMAKSMDQTTSELKKKMKDKWKEIFGDEEIQL